MSEVINDPMFDQVTDQVDTDFPLLAPGIYDLDIVDAATGPSKSTPGAQTLTISLHTKDVTYDTKGGALQPGFPVYHRIGVTPTADYPADKICRNVAMVAKSAGLTGVTVGAIIGNPKEHLVGKVVRCKVKVNKATESFGESNGVSFIS